MGLIATVTLVVALLALWSIRHAWSIPIERPATITVALLAVDVLLMTPQLNWWLSRRLHAITGVWNLEDLTGHICVLIAMCSLLYLMADRLDMNPAQFRWFVRYRIELPCTIAIALMVAIFLPGDIADRYITDTVAVGVPLAACLLAHHEHRLLLPDLEHRSGVTDSPTRPPVTPSSHRIPRRGWHKCLLRHSFRIGDRAAAMADGARRVDWLRDSRLVHLAIQGGRPAPVTAAKPRLAHRSASERLPGRPVSMTGAPFAALPLVRPQRRGRFGGSCGQPSPDAEPNVT